MRQADLEHTLRAILEDLEPYRLDLVLMGGWVPYLYRHYGGFSAWGGEDTLTFELDVLVERPLPSAGRPRLAEVLREASFRPEGGDSSAAVWVRDGDARADRVHHRSPRHGPWAGPRGAAHGTTGDRGHSAQRNGGDAEPHPSWRRICSTSAISPLEGRM
jgi:hypothetical protein